MGGHQAARDRHRCHFQRRAATGILCSLSAPPPQRHWWSGRPSAVCRHRELPQIQGGTRARKRRPPSGQNVAFLPKCTGPITYIGKAELDAECAALNAADEASGRGAVAPFLTAASPGILASIVKNEHYPSFDAYIDAIAAALRIEYETIVGSGFYLQIDAPDLALERHVAFSKRPLK